MSLETCSNCNEIFIGSHRSIPVVFDPVYCRLSVQCPECDHIINIKILDDGQVVEDV